MEVRIIRITVYWGLYGGPFIFGNYHNIARRPKYIVQTYIGNLGLYHGRSDTVNLKAVSDCFRLSFLLMCGGFEVGMSARYEVQLTDALNPKP